MRVSRVISSRIRVFRKGFLEDPEKVEIGYSGSLFIKGEEEEWNPR